jgi:hypothetical protein
LNSKNISTAGMMIAIGIVILYISTVIQINTIAILTVASSLIPITIIKSNMKTAISVYICTTIISLFLVPINLLLLYGCFFGIYGIIKFFIEKLKNRIIEIILKLAYFNITIFVLVYILQIAIGPAYETLPIYLIIASSELLFLLYDYSLTLIISYYINKIDKK